MNIPITSSSEDLANREITPIRWQDDTLILLDQTVLPEKIQYLHLQTPEDVWHAISHLQVRGAPAIGIAAAYGVYLGIQHVTSTHLKGRSLHEKLTSVFEIITSHIDYLATSRPTAVNLFWALERMKQTAEKIVINEGSLDQLKAALLDEAMTIHQEDEQTNRQIGEYALRLFQPGDGVLTHCNAGGLATAKYGTALAPFYLAKERNIPLRIFADETRPILQGARLTAFELHQAGIDVTLICDNMAGHVMAKGWIQAVIVGTDRVARNGDVANKIGTYSVAILAKAHGIPFYVACPTSTIDLKTQTGADIPIEERPQEEITEGFGKRTAPLGIHVYNPAFDITPHRYVSAIITEKGIIYPPFERQLINIHT